MHIKMMSIEELEADEKGFYSGNASTGRLSGDVGI